MEPSNEDLKDPEFLAIWKVIKGWDLARDSESGYSHATGTDVMTILTALRELKKDEKPERIFNWDTGTAIETAVFEAIGAASMCWETPEGAGVFESTRAKQIGDELIEYFHSKGPIY